MKHHVKEKKVPECKNFMDIRTTTSLIFMCNTKKDIFDIIIYLFIGIEPSPSKVGPMFELV